MRPTRQQLIDCCNATDKNLGFDINAQLTGKTVDVLYDGSYLTSEELVFFRYDKDHKVNINGVDYNSTNLPDDIFEKVVKRTHKVKVELLHKLCLLNYFNYVDTVNQFEDENFTTGKFINDFEYYYTVLRQTNDNELRTNYRRYWREIIVNNAYAIATNNNEFSATLNNRAKPILHGSLMTLYNRMTLIA